MIRAVTVTNLETGYDLVLTLRSPETSQGFAVVSMSGLGPGQATVNTSEWVTIDGAHIDATHLPKRTITIQLQFVPTSYSESVADIRRKSYLYFPIKKYVRLTFEHVDLRGNTKSYFIEGIIEKNEPDIWSEEEGCTLSIVCADPHFQDTEEIIENFDQVIDMFHFEFPDEASGHPFPISEQTSFVDREVYNKSSIDIGAVFVLTARGPLSNPMIYNRTTNERMALNYEMQAGESIAIDTRVGHKTIRTRDGLNTNKIQYLMLDSKWIHLQPGYNTIGWHCDSGASNLKMYYSVRPLYQGI